MSIPLLLQWPCALALLAAAGFAPAKPVLDLSDKVIRDAVRATLAESREEPPRRAAEPLRADRYKVFAEAFAEARVPDCLHADALKRQPPAIGPIGFGGLLAIPFVGLAQLNGKCN